MFKRLALCAFVALAATPLRAEVLVFAAASLKGPLDQLAAQVDGVTISYAGSGTLARQVLQGAPADIVVLANVAWMDALEQGGAIMPQSKTDIASNALVMIGPVGSEPLPLDAEAILARLNRGRIATGFTHAVPAGIYAKAAMTTLGLWPALQGQLAEVDNVRAAVALVANGQAPLGIVYATDAALVSGVTEVAAIPSDSHPPIRYLAAATNLANAEALDFLAMLAAGAGQAELARAGFLPAFGSMVE